MSTKTTFKRIALVAVAALGFGVLSVAPSSAALGVAGAVTTTLSATGAITGTATDPFPAGSAISLNVLIDLNDTGTAVNGDTFTITYNAYNPKGETITGITLVETSTSVSLLPTVSTVDSGSVVAVGNTLVFKDTISATAFTAATLTIPADAVTGGGIYTVKATKITASTAATFNAGNLDGTTGLSRGLINVRGAQVTQGTLTGAAAGNAVTGGNARMQFFFPKVAANGDVYRITSSGVGTILSEQGDDANTTPSPVSGTTYAGGVNLAVANTAVASAPVFNLTSDVAGVQTLTFWSQSTATGQLTAVFTGTVTWGAAPAYVDSTAFLSTTTSAAATADAAATARKSSAVYSATAVARISVKQYTDAAKTIQTAGTAKAVVVTITGAGAVDTKSDGSTRGSQATVAASATAAVDSDFYVFADGRAGAATIAITVNGVALKSYTWNFTGTATSLKEDADNSPSKTYIGVGETGTLSVMSYDANANEVSDAPAVFATSDTVTVATVSSTGTGSVTVTGVAVGKTNINICLTACASATVKLSIPVEITKTTAETVTVSFDKDSYEPGEKMVLTVSAVDSNGRPVADGARALLAAAMTSNVSFGGASVALPGASVALEGGKAEYTLYAPSSSGAVTVTGKEGAGTASTTKAALTASAVVNNSAVDAATDAANEAVDAANAATDAALAAAEAADAATTAAQEASDAVAALSESVTKLIAGLQAQIKSLAAVVAKIAKKVKA